MSYVFVVDGNECPLDPVHPGAARRMLSRGEAAVWRRYPFTLILKRGASDANPAPLRLKIDPGSRTTGLALVTDGASTTRQGRVLWAGEVAHRGHIVHERMLARRASRHSRRQRHTRYRPSRFANRRRPDDWLPPSLQSRLTNVDTWVRRLRRVAPITAISQELVRFDTHALVNPEVSGVACQQGTLAGYEVREYLLEKWGRKCAYCQAGNVPLQVEHIVPRARGGTDCMSNLTLACAVCNQRKGAMTAEEFGYPQVQAQALRPLKDAAAVNITRWTLYRRLCQTGLPVEAGSGGRTKWNRTQRDLPKMHWLDAACVGASTPERVVIDGVRPLRITATGHGTRQMCGTNKYGFPTRHRTRRKRHFDMQTGDLVRAVVPADCKTAGVHVGRVLVRASGSFDVIVASGGRRVAGIGSRYMRVLARGDGYTCAYNSTLARERGQHEGGTCQKARSSPA